MLHLVSVRGADATLPTREALWASILEISVRSQGVDAFTIDSTTQAGRSKDNAARDAELLRSLGIQADDRRRELHPLEGHYSTLAELGPRVLSIELYADRAWVSGISDWGDDLSALLDDESFSQLLLVSERLDPGLKLDVIEAGSRPTFSGGRG